MFILIFIQSLKTNKKKNKKNLKFKFRIKRNNINKN